MNAVEAIPFEEFTPGQVVKICQGGECCIASYLGGKVHFVNEYESVILPMFSAIAGNLSGLYPDAVITPLPAYSPT